MTHEQQLESRRNHRKAAKELHLTKGYVLHHKDTEMKKNDVERYIKWNPEDLMLLTIGEHNQLHKGYKVRCIETGETFPSAFEADKHYNLCRGNISSAIRLNCRAAGMHWEYA